MSEPTIRELQFQTAMWALKQIERKQGGFTHSWDKTQTCDCPQCIVRDALEQIKQYEMRAFEKAVARG